MQPDQAGSDPILDALIQEVTDDSDAVGPILSGSRAVGLATEQSDYDLFWVLADAAYDRRQANGESLRARRELPGQPYLDVVFICQRELDRLPSSTGWWTYGYATARVLVDKTGAVARALQVHAWVPRAEHGEF